MRPALFLALLVTAIGCSTTSDAEPVATAAQPLKDTQGWAHVWYVASPDHEYEGDALTVYSDGSADLIFRRNAAAADGGVDVVNEEAFAVPCWKPQHPIALTAGPPFTAFAYPTPDPRTGYPVAIDVSQDAGAGTLTIARGGDAGIVTSVLDNADEHPESWVFPMWYAWPIYPIPGDGATIMADQCKASADGGSP